MGHRVTSVRCTSADFPFGFGGDAVTWRPGKGDAWKEHNLSGYMGNFCTCLDVYRCKKYLESNLLLYRFHQFKDRTQGPNKKHRTILGNNCCVVPGTLDDVSKWLWKKFSFEVVFTLLKTAEVSPMWGAIFLGKVVPSAEEVSTFCFFFVNVMFGD